MLRDVASVFDNVLFSFLFLVDFLSVDFELQLPHGRRLTLFEPVWGLDVLVILLDIRTCTLDVLVILLGIIDELIN